MVVRELIILNDPLSYSLVLCESIRIVFAGVNTADKSTPITLLLNIGTGMANSMNIDAYVSYDALYYIDSSGVISVSH